MKAPSARPGYHDRGLIMSAYPTSDQTVVANTLQPSIRSAWNWMVYRVESVLQAKDARAVRERLIDPPIPKPNYKGLEPAQAKAHKIKYKQECADRRIKIFKLGIPVEWRPPLSGKASEAERLGLKYDYQVLNWHLRCVGLPELPAAIGQDLVVNFYKKSVKRKKFRKVSDVMPLQVRSGQQLRLKNSSDNDDWYQRRCNVEAWLPKVGWIACYADPGILNQLLTPGNTAREGCALFWEQDRCYIRVNIIRREQIHPGPTDQSAIGIDPGLASLVTTSDGEVVPNPRNLKYAAARELALSIVDTLPKGPERDHFRSCVFRHDIRLKHKVHTQLRQFSAHLSNKYEFIGVESNSGIALGLGSRYTGATKTLVKYLVERCGTNRVHEVEAAYNSQDCSSCGHPDKETWARRLGERDQTCQCLNCGFICDRDVNGAGNVKKRLLEFLSPNPCGG